MAPGTTSQQKRKDAIQRREAAAVAAAAAAEAAAAAVEAAWQPWYSGERPSASGCPTGQSGTRPIHHLEGLTPAPYLEDAIPSVGDSDATPTPSECPPALSIRCKKTKLPDMVDMATGNPTTIQRGIVVGTKTEYLVRMNNNRRLQVPYSTRHRGPATREFRSLLTRDIGSIIRGKVPMLAPNFLGLSQQHRDIVNTQIETNYDIPATDAEMWNFIDATAQSIYKDWKHDCHQHYLQVSEETPAEFLWREDEWAWLKVHFEDPAYVKLCERNRGNRNKNKEQQLNHHSGSLALSYRSEVLEKEGHRAPAVQTWINVYQPDKNAAEKVTAMKRRLDEVLSQQDSVAGDTDGDTVSQAHPLSLDTQINIIEEEVGSRHGTSIRGVGRALTRDPKPRGGVRLEETQSLKREVAEARDEARRSTEEARRSTEEARRSTEVARKATEDFNNLVQRVQEMEALMRSFQAQAPPPPPGT